ncbi:MAG: hypothetical protein K5880_06920 [Hydrogenophaga sp.]|uniref:hypothetical protein n=1 Tax=Hydrogenophaga sp. TaxID=1904254 RepID=UPI00260AABCD|nr:hypothetical protein [Hydrogenophaga sp.]MCV0438345.1 hypothetical protein [Hydrogenophaga sp.]
MEVAQAQKIADRSHRQGDLNRCFVVVGASLETFLARHLVVPDAGGKLKNLIDAAGQYGLGADAVAVLHDFRQNWYNAAKHKAQFAPSTYDALTLLKRVLSAIDEFSGSSIPDIHTKLASGARRLFWIGFWDHYIGGDTEVQIALPSYSGAFSRNVDTIYIGMSAWDNVKVALPAVGIVHDGKIAMPSEIYQNWSEEDGFLCALVFEGDYQALIKMLAKHERQEKLIPDLLRENQTRSMVAACMFAAVVACQSGRCRGDAASVRSAIRQTAQDEFAAPQHSKVAAIILDSITELICSQPRETRGLLSGPEWINDQEYQDELSAGAVHDKARHIAITDDHRLIIRS